MTRYRFINILQNLHFSDNQTADKSDKPYNVFTVINHLNKEFQDVMSDVERQLLDEDIAQFNGQMSCKQHMKNKHIKWDFKWWHRCCSKTIYVYEFDIYLDNKENNSLGLGKLLFWICIRKYKINTVCSILTTCSILQHLLRILAIGEDNTFGQFELTGIIRLL